MRIEIQNLYGGTSIEFDAPNQLPLPGEDYEFIHNRGPIKTKGGEMYYMGDKLRIIGRTTNAPHESLSSVGNLYIKGKNKKVTVWSNIELLIMQKVLKLVVYVK